MTRDFSSAEITEGLCNQHCTIGHSPICFTNSVVTNHVEYICIYIYTYVWMYYVIYSVLLCIFNEFVANKVLQHKWMMIRPNIKPSNLAHLIGDRLIPFHSSFELIVGLYMWAPLKGLPSLKLTAKAPENRPGPKRKFLFQPSIFRGYVKLREGNF